MKKKILLTLFLCLFVVSTASPQSWVYNENCIQSPTTGLASLAGAATTATNGTEFTAVPIKVSRRDGGGHSSVVTITISFTTDGGGIDSNDVDFYFQASYDNGTTYTSDEFVIIDCPADTTASSNAVKHMEQVNVYGISHLRLWKIVNNEADDTITLINATISGGR